MNISSTATIRFTYIQLMLGFLIRQILLHHSTNLAVGVEVGANGTLLVKWSSDFLGGASDCTVGCVCMSACIRVQHARYFATVKHLADSTVFGEHACAGALSLVACSGLTPVRTSIHG